MNSILVIDDDEQLRKSFHKMLAEEGYDVSSASSGEAGIELVSQNRPDLVILDMRMPGLNGLETFKRINAIDRKLPVIIMTAYATTESAIEATKLGAFDYVLKPFDIPKLLTIIRDALNAVSLMKSPDEEQAVSRIVKDTIIGRSAPMQEVYKIIGQVSTSDATVLVRGESGTGKELVVRAIWQHSRRSGKPFQVINCVAIPETLLESELFGYEKGAFTGAAGRKIGKIEQSQGGTVFLDEIGDMPIMLQSKILRLIQERSIERIGGRETISVDVRIIAATNRNLEEAIAEGRFREDLYYRLTVVTLSLPPLRDRKDDIPLLADFFLSKFSAELEVPNPGITEEAVDELRKYDWPGNIRELSNVIQKVLIFNRGIPVSAFEISRSINLKPSAHVSDSQSLNHLLQQKIREHLISDQREGLFDLYMDEYASMIISEALEVAGGNRSKAAKILGISRPTLHSRIDKYNISLETSVSKESF